MSFEVTFLALWGHFCLSSDIFDTWSDIFATQVTMTICYPISHLSTREIIRASLMAWGSSLSAWERLMHVRSTNQQIPKTRLISEGVITQAFADPNCHVIFSRPFSVAGVLGGLRLYPKGSKHCTQPGFCSFYIRCGEGTHMGFELFVGNVKHEVMECTWTKPNDRGRNDFCNFSEQFNSLPPPRQLVCGVDILEIISPSKPGAILP